MDLRGAPFNTRGGGVYPLETDRGTSKRADVVLGYLTMYGPGPQVHPAGWFSSVCMQKLPSARCAVPSQSEQQKVFDMALALRSERQSLPCLHVSEAYVHLVCVAPLAERMAVTVVQHLGAGGAGGGVAAAAAADA